MCHRFLIILSPSIPFHLFIYFFFYQEIHQDLYEFLTNASQPGNNCAPLMNVHQDCDFPISLADLNVILLSHQGTESCPWMAKGYSVANEVCIGPLGNGSVTPKLLDTLGRSYSMAQTLVVC